MPVTATILRVAIPTPLRRLFDYRLPNEAEVASPGVRVEVNFGSRHLYGVVMATATSSELPPERLKSVSTVLDAEPLVPAALLELMTWAAAYYQYPPGEVVLGVLPAPLRQGAAATVSGEDYWQLTPAGVALDVAGLQRAPRQSDLLQLLTAHPHGMSATQLDDCQDNWRPVMNKLVQKGWVEKQNRLPAPAVAETERIPNLNPAQQDAVDSISAGLGEFGVSLLDGVTGSGKTEVYLNLIEQVIRRGEQALVLVPEIGLTPQLLQRFQQRFPLPIAVLHSGLGDRERLNAWLLAKQGDAPIIIGTRSAVFTPMLRPGLIILDEEHDLSFKQQEGFRYSARDVAIKRAQMEGLPVVLGSATPSLESLQNAYLNRYSHLHLPERAGTARHPRIDVLDIRKQPMKQGLSSALLNAMRRHLADGGQVMLFLNRRGYAPALLCHDCGWISPCQRCDSRMTLFGGQAVGDRAVRQRLRCHHCGAERPAETSCPQCGSEDLHAVGAGTERLEEILRQEFPETGIVRIDRDTTRRKGSMQTMLDDIHKGNHRILVGTQMLAKGHHFPEVTLVGIVDVDQGLLSVDFRATERMAQLIIQVAGRAGRAEKSGQVLIQTHYPDNPLLRVLIQEGYSAFARAALAEREQARLPPFSYQALLRAEAADRQLPLEFLQQARSLATSLDVAGVQLLGPVPAPMEKRAGRVRAQLMLQADSRADLHRLLTPWLLQLEEHKLGRKVRWSIDVDPQETY